MLLITFIENAFKHGACSIKDCFVKISLLVKGNTLILRVINSIPKNKKEIISTKIGIVNTKQRLNIIYPNRYQLDIKSSTDIFDVQLEIQLA